MNIRCQFSEAWIGQCVFSAKENEKFCHKHSKLKCHICGKKATHTCGETSQFVCGAPLCDDANGACSNHPRENKMKKPSKKSSKENQTEDECSIEMSFARELSELKKNSETHFENTKQKLISENRPEMEKLFFKEYKNKMIEEAKNGGACFFIYVNGNYPDSWGDLTRRNFSTYQIEVLYVQTCVESFIQILKDLGFEESKIEVLGTPKDIRRTIKITF